MPEVVCVLGMLRTGTSLVAGILERLGFYFGSPDNILDANRANPTGFLEHKEIIKINDALLEEFGGSWWSPPDLPTGWASSQKVLEIREHASSLVSREFGGRQRWAWKDPRACLTLPFWRTLVPTMKYVICVRDPAESAESLSSLPWALRKLGNPIKESLELWKRYTASAMEETSDLPRMLIFYQDVITNPQHEATRLATFSNRMDALNATETRLGISELVRPQLWHSKAVEGQADEALAEPRRLYFDLMNSKARWQPL